MKTSQKVSYVCVPSSKINFITEALQQDGYINDIKMFRGRDARMQALTIQDRLRTYRQIIKNCPSIDLESESLSSEYMIKNFVGMLCIILVSHYDEDELTKYCINAINKSG